MLSVTCNGEMRFPRHLNARFSDLFGAGDAVSRSMLRGWRTASSVARDATYYWNGSSSRVWAWPSSPQASSLQFGHGCYDAGIAAAGSKNVILNLAEVNYIDSTGLGALVMCATTLRKAGGDAKLLNLSKRSLELLVITKLVTVFALFTDEQDAVNSFFPDREIKAFDILSYVQQSKREEG